MTDNNCASLTTEQRNKGSENLDRLSTIEILQCMNDEDQTVPAVVGKNLDVIAQAVDLISAQMAQGGRLFYVGAGTSGRLGILDASECPPTFGTAPELVQGIIAGGDHAIREAIEGAEDDTELGRDDLVQRRLQPEDVVVGIAASGRTPYVIGALTYAKTVGAKTIALSCNSPSRIGALADIAIEIPVGPEVLTGSTRLKAGTAQKLVLNMLTTATMVKLGKVYGNLMVDVQATNEKLRTRSLNIIRDVTGVDKETATRTYRAASGNVKVAIVMLLADVSEEVATKSLDANGGRIRQALEQLAQRRN